jgi:hypothetical protein
MFKKSMGLVKSSPDVSTAAHSGTPQMNPPGEDSGSETMGGGTRQTSIVASGGGVTGSNAVPVRTVTPAEAVPPTGDQAGDPADAAQDIPKQPALADQLPNHDDGTAKKREQKKEESSSKKKGGFWKLIPF